MRPEDVGRAQPHLTFHVNDDIDDDRICSTRPEHRLTQASTLAVSLSFICRFLLSQSILLHIQPCLGFVITLQTEPNVSLLSSEIVEYSSLLS